MDEDLVLVENCHPESMNLSRPTSPICTMRIGDPVSDTESATPESKCVKNNTREEEAPMHGFSSSANGVRDEPSSSKDFCRTQEIKVSHQYTGGCVKKTRKPILVADPRPVPSHRGKLIRAERISCEHSEDQEMFDQYLKNMSPPLDFCRPPPSPELPLPPPPPPFSTQPFGDLFPEFSHVPVPAPPPLPPLPQPRRPRVPPIPSYFPPQFLPDVEVKSAENLISVQSAEASANHTTNLIVGIIPFQRKVFLMRHQAYAADFQEYEWLLRLAETGVWYEKPTGSQTSVWRNEGFHPTNKVVPIPHPKQLLKLDLPKLWASAALTTPLDHATTVATQSGSKALKSIPLVYCLVISTYEACNNMVPESKSYGNQTYKVIRCGSREAAVTEAYITVGIHGHNVVFACVMRLDEDFAGDFVKAKKVEKLSDLVLDDFVREGVRVFY